METRSTTEKGKLSINFLGEKTMSGEFSNADLVQFIEVAGGFLNLQTIPDYAKKYNLSYNGVKKHREIVTIFNVKFVIDNE
jgi:hypothetical protein